MNYEQALAWVHSLPRLAPRPGVENTRRLLQKLGDPQQKLQFVHVAGTNGKGSTVVMLASVLHTAGYKTGATVSPYVLDFRERFLLNGAMIDCDTLARLLTQVREAAQGEEIVEFDAVTVAALLWFAQERCDIVCAEVGLGGRLDSTNAIENTLVACVTRIGLDHTELLGDTCAKIAAEKCGIFKNNCTVVTYPAQPTEALAVIRERAALAGCPLVEPCLSDIMHIKGEAFENRIVYENMQLAVPFAGRHQACNAAVVVQAAWALRKKGFAISEKAIQSGIAAARFPARIEVLSRKPLVILDGAHNADGAQALAQTLLHAGKIELTAVLGVLRDKQPEEMLRVLSPCLQRIYTVTPDSPRAMPAKELATLARQYVQEVHPCEDVHHALRLAQANAPQGLVVCGSLYLAAQARKILIL